MMNGPDDFIGPVNLGNPGEFTIRELAELVIELTGVEVEARPASRCRPTTRRGAGPTSRSPRRSSAGSRRCKLREGLAETIKWFRSIRLEDYRAPTPNY